MRLYWPLSSLSNLFCRFISYLHCWLLKFLPRHSSINFNFWCPSALLLRGKFLLVFKPVTWELFEPRGHLTASNFLTELLCRVYRACGLERTLASTRWNEANYPQYVLFSKIQRSIIPTQLVDARAENSGELRRLVHLNSHPIRPIHAFKQEC